MVLWHSRNRAQLSSYYHQMLKESFTELNNSLFRVSEYLPRKIFTFTHKRMLLNMFIPKNGKPNVICRVRWRNLQATTDIVSVRGTKQLLWLSGCGDAKDGNNIRQNGREHQKTKRKRFVRKTSEELHTDLCSSYLDRQWKMLPRQRNCTGNNVSDSYFTNAHVTVWHCAKVRLSAYLQQSFSSCALMSIIPLGIK